MTVRDKTKHYKPKDEIKSRVIPVRVTPLQADRYAKLAERKKIGLSRWMRDALERVADEQENE
jgi:hypothetical protein